MRFSAPVKEHWLGSFSIVLPPGLRGFVPVVRDRWEQGPRGRGPEGGEGVGARDPRLRWRGTRSWLRLRLVRALRALTYFRTASWTAETGREQAGKAQHMPFRALASHSDDPDDHHEDNEDGREEENAP